MVQALEDFKARLAEKKEKASLEQYTKNRHELLETLSQLHSLSDIADDLGLPQIAVVGSQSVGKSSLIESMSGISLPRDNGICTRCPMECRLENAPAWTCKITLRFRVDSSNKPLQEAYDIGFGKTLSDKDEVEEMLRRAQRAVLRPGVDVNLFLNDEDLTVPGYTQSFSNNCVCIRVAGPNVPDLYFYDLPGIIANVGDGGTEEDIKLIEDLAKSYIMKPDCLILLVISCETDFENQGAGRLVLRDRDLRQRTIGVLTKVDRIEAGATTKWAKMLRNQETALKHGWFAVKQPNPSQLRAGISWDDARKSERTFFQTTEPWATLEDRFRQCLGSINLAEHLSLTLSRITAMKLPIIRARIEVLLKQTAEDLDAIPERNTADPRKQVIKLLTGFSRRVSKQVEGLPPHTLTAPSGLISSLNEHYTDFRLQVHRTAPRFRPWESTVKPENEILQDMVRQAEIDDAEGAQGKIVFVDQVWKLAQRSRTREWPGNYPFAVKENMVRESILEWKSLAIACFNVVEQTLIEHLNDLVHDHFEQEANPSLMDAVNEIIHQQLQICAESAKARIDDACEGELDKYFTQNEHYFFVYREKLLSRYKSLFRRSRGEQSFILGSRNPNTLTQDGITTTTVVPDASVTEDINAILAAFARRGIHGLVPEDLAKILPFNVMDTGLEIMAEVRAYFQVAYKRFSDSVPIQIDAGFIRTFDSGLEVALLTLMGLDVEQCSRYLEESASTTQRRKELKTRKEMLELAKRKLDQSSLSRLKMWGIDSEGIDEDDDDELTEETDSGKGQDELPLPTAETQDLE